MDKLQEETVKLDGKTVTKRELNEQKQQAPASKKIVEVEEGKEYKTLTRMNG
jgi:hypothetical protein